MHIAARCTFFLAEREGIAVYLPVDVVVIASRRPLGVDGRVLGDGIVAEVPYVFAFSFFVPSAEDVSIGSRSRRRFGDFAALLHELILGSGAVVLFVEVHGV